MSTDMEKLNMYMIKFFKKSKTKLYVKSIR